MRLDRVFVLAELGATGIAPAATIGYFQTNLTSEIPPTHANSAIRVGSTSTQCGAVLSRT
jgi:hypothetical protein